MKLTEFIQDVGRPIAFYPGLRKITGSTTATLLLCQLIYWTGKQADPDGWIYKTSDDIEEETGLSYDEQVTARKQLVKNGFIEEQYKRLDHQMAFRIMASAINEEWRKPNHGIGETVDIALGKADLGDSLNGSSETTTETTSYNQAIFHSPLDDEIDPEEYKGLSDRFTKVTGILPYKNKEWDQAIQDLLQNKITVELLSDAIDKLRGAKMNISGPWSVVKTAVGIVNTYSGSPEIR